MKKRILSFLTVCALVTALPFYASAHPGRTDSKGGHWNRKTGTYHYHNGGGSSGSSGGSPASRTPKTVYAKSINAKNIPSHVNAGDTVKLEASAYPTNAEDKDIFWESSDASVVTVTATGELTAVGVGTAVVTAKTSRGTSKKFTVTVNEVVAQSISLSANDSEILIGGAKKLQCAFFPENTTNKTLEWTSSDENILSVSADGTLTANNIGSATVTATHNDLTDSLEIEVKPIEPESIKITFPAPSESGEETPKLRKGAQLQLNAEIMPDNATYKDIVWTVSDENIASIDKNGLLTANATGIVAVTATAVNGVKSETEIEIYSNTAAVIAVAGIAALISAVGVVYFKKKKNS